MTQPTWTRWDAGRVSGYAWAADRPRATLLLQHGFGEYAERFVDDHSQLIPRLRNEGISVFAFDMRGHGGSPGQRGIVDVEQEAQRHVAARRSLTGSTLPLFLMGHSLGGLVTAASVLMDPAGIDGVILSSPAFARGNVVARRFIERIARISPEWRAAKPQSPSGLSRDEASVKRLDR